MTDSKSSDSIEAENQVVDESLASETVESLGTTVGTFANRIRRKLREQEIKDDVSQKETELRHARILQAMTTIRKALQETCKIKLGKRFYMNLDVDDWEGWPRLELKLVDLKAPDRIDYSLLVTANDRKDRGNVMIHLRSGQLLAHLQLAVTEEVQRIPLILKKSVRKYLDIVADYVLNPKKPSELIEEQTKELDVDHEEDIHDNQLQKENLFSRDLVRDENRVVAIEKNAPLERVSFEDSTNNHNPQASSPQDFDPQDSFESEETFDPDQYFSPHDNTVSQAGEDEPLTVSSFEKKKKK